MTNDTFGLAALTAELEEDEGHRQFPYSDTRGCLSIGRGRNLTGKGMSPDEIDYLFANDVNACVYDLDRNATWWRKLPAAQQRVMLNLCFNMGWKRFATFVRFLAAMEAWDWPRAAVELRDSLWWGQVGTRGPRVVARLLATDGAPVASAQSKAATYEPKV